MTKKADETVALSDKEIAERDAARGFTDADLAEALDVPEWTDEQLRAAKPFVELFPYLPWPTKPPRRSRRA